MPDLRVLGVVLLVLLSVQRSECVQCFGRFDRTKGQCHESIGEVDEDNCCQNPHYGYQDTDGVCHSCGPPSWSPWSPWSYCNVLCGEGVTYRSRTCFGIGKSECENSADNRQIKPCNGTCCNVEGWGSWQPWTPCSVTCGVGGARARIRVCSSPPECHCACSGPSEEEEACPSQGVCPVDGLWTGWSPWGECSSSCIPQGSVSVRTRRRTCSNPAPSSNPPGRTCQGDNEERDNCDHLPHCQVDGGWGSWSPFSPPTVTCGVGVLVSERKCENPAPQHGGKPCSGEARRTRIYRTNVYCPVDGVWSEWSPWQECKYPFGERNIRCKPLGGSQVRVRQCLYQAHNGSICSGEDLTDRRACYDVSSCYVKGTWDGWGTWSLCRVGRGGQYHRIRERHCKPDYSKYSPTIGRHKEVATFFGKPQADCGDVPDNGKKFEVQPCLNVPGPLKTDEFNSSIIGDVYSTISSTTDECKTTI